MTCAAAPTETSVAGTGPQPANSLGESTMKLSRIVLVAAGLTALAPGLATAAVPAPAAAVKTFIDDFNKGDIAGAQATNADDVSIIDEVAPHAWRGPGAFQAWLGAVGKDAKDTGKTDEKVAFLGVVRSQVDGDDAYAVVKVEFRYRQHGRRMIEPAQMVASLHNDGGTWKINSWAWTGGVPHAAVAAKPKTPATPAAPAAPAKP